VAVTCLEVRELLPELAVGVLPPRDRQEVERHLRWCAGCRKEAGELGEAAATIAFALPPAELADELRERVVDDVKRAAGAPGRPQRARGVAASILTAAVVAASLGWGAVMAQRADRFEERANDAQRRRAEAIALFEQLIDDPLLLEGDRLDQTRLGRLAPTADGQGAGMALQLVRPRFFDFSLVVVNGFDPRAADRLPYHVEFENGAGDVVRAGRITELDAEGHAEAFREFANRDLTGYTLVRVVDANGVVVLEGRAGDGI
jgi:hypothetical protein